MALYICYDEPRMKSAEIMSILLLALVGGMYWGPWLALTRTISNLKPEVFLAVVSHLSKNMADVMTPLVPLSLLSTVPVLILSFSQHRATFYLTLAALMLFILTLIITLLIEVPIVKQMESWTVNSLPENWIEKRDKWGSFHYLRVFPAILGLLLMITGALI
jgi:uncharacterized membrane protein